MDEILNNSIDDLNGRYLTFYIAEAIYGLELKHVIEIIKMEPITPVPNVAYYIKGIINLRGKIVPVIDVRTKFSLEGVPYDDKTCIIVVVINDMQVGLIVDQVSEVVSAEQAVLTTPPTAGGNNASKYLSSIATFGNRVVLNIDCERFFMSDLGSGALY